MAKTVHLDIDLRGTRLIQIQALLNRYIDAQNLLEKHPEQEELLSRQMARAKEDLFELCLANSGHMCFQTPLPIPFSTDKK